MVRIRFSFGSRHTGKIKNIKKQRSKYPDVMRDVIRVSDVVLQVLDARYVSEMRNLEVEKMIKNKGAKIINVLNKADLVDKKEIEAKLPEDMKPYVFISTKSGAGARDLRDRIKIEAKRIELPDKKQRVQIGIVGYPNAGKSSLINLLSRRGATKTSSKAGYTKGMQKVRFSKDVLLLDTPGVIPDAEYASDDKSFSSRDAKLGARTYSDVRDPEDVVHYLMTPPLPEDIDNPTKEELKEIKDVEIAAKKIQKFYEIEAEGDSEVLIEKLGKKMNFLKKGGHVDVDRTARVILRDWQNGSIK